SGDWSSDVCSSDLIGQASSRLGNDQVLDTFAELGVLFPSQLLADAGMNSVRGTISAAGARLADQVQALETAIDSGQASEIVSAALALAVTLGQLIDAFAHLPAALVAATP